MTEKVKIDSGSSAASLLWQAMLHTGDEDLWETFGIELGFKELVVDVTVTVNGVEVPFLEGWAGSLVSTVPMSRTKLSGWCARA